MDVDILSRVATFVSYSILFLKNETNRRSISEWESEDGGKVKDEFKLWIKNVKELESICGIKRYKKDRVFIFIDIELCFFFVV